ncbi:hypothetical protein AB0G54_42675 [Streptomyces yokosukanensis]|uniref:hypothetical protein n=1 Tax=Streptomyces yokosukanensis TaxID=67386 RepID=UPI003442858C
MRLSARDRENIVCNTCGATADSSGAGSASPSIDMRRRIYPAQEASPVLSSSPSPPSPSLQALFAVTDEDLGEARRIADLFPHERKMFADQLTCHPTKGDVLHR